MWLHWNKSQAHKVADYLINFSHEVGDPITNLKLQKLLYYAQGWYLALHDRPLFTERIEAWAHGPTVPPVYGDFKKWRWDPITERQDDPHLPKDIEEHLTEVMQVYGIQTAYYLERLTHSERPWLLARGTAAPGEPSNAVISTDEMKLYFRSLAEAKGDDQERQAAKRDQTYPARPTT